MIDQEIDHEKANDWGDSMAERYDVADHVGIATAYHEMGADDSEIAEYLDTDLATVEELHEKMETAVDRLATRRGRAIARRHGLRKQVGLATAYKRLGFSASGLSKRLGVTTSTAKGYLDTVADRFGDAALFPHHAPDENDPLTGHAEPADDGDDNPEPSHNSSSGSADDPLSNVEAINGGENE